MSATLEQVAEQILGTLRASDPELDTSVGTPARKIIDAVAYAISNAYVDQHILSYQYDIDSKAGADLDAFTQLFGIARLAAKRASGFVTFTRAGSTTALVTIPAGTIIATTSTPMVMVSTVVAGAMTIGDTTVSIPVLAVDPGSSGNLPSDALTFLTSPVVGINSVTNVEPITGGTEAETDSELRARWKSTVFRSLAGTEQMYRGIALSDPNCTSANVLGSSKRFRERIQLVSGAATSTVTDAKYVYPTNVFVGSSLDDGIIAIKDVDYTWNNTIPPTISGASSVVFPGDPVVDLDFEYVDEASRNDPANGIANKVDVWVAGRRAKTATQVIVWKTAQPTFGTSGVMNRTNFVRTDGSNPANGAYFVPLAFGPILEVPEVISIGGSTYSLVGSGASADYTDAYRVVHQDTADGYTPSSLFGLEWYTTHHPANGATATIGANDDYLYNEVPATIQVEIDRWRLVGIDAKAHQGREVLLRFNLAVMYDGTQSTGTVDAAIDAAIAKQLTTLGISGTVQASDILQTVHSISGVDAVRFLGAGDAGAGDYGDQAFLNAHGVGIQRIQGGAVTHTYMVSPGITTDVLLDDSEYSSLESTNIVVKAQNTFGAS